MNQQLTFTEDIKQIHKLKSLATAQEIKTGKLPEDYKMPDLKYFKDKLSFLEPAYVLMREQGWEPEIIFVPKGLELAQWNELMKGYDLGKGKLSNGTYRTWKGYELENTGHYTGGRWDVAIVSGAERPVFTSVSKDGMHGPGAESALRALRALPGMSASMPPGQVTSQASPSEDLYFALQLTRLERGELPVDSETWTMGKEDVRVVQGLGSLYFNYGEHHRLIRSVWNERSFFFEDDGIRPSVEAGLVHLAG